MSTSPGWSCPTCGRYPQVLGCTPGECHAAGEPVTMPISFIASRPEVGAPGSGSFSNRLDPKPFERIDLPPLGRHPDAGAPPAKDRPAPGPARARGLRIAYISRDSINAGVCRLKIEADCLDPSPNLTVLKTQLESSLEMEALLRRFIELQASIFQCSGRHPDDDGGVCIHCDTVDVLDRIDRADK